MFIITFQNVGDHRPSVSSATRKRPYEENKEKWGKPSKRPDHPSNNNSANDSINDTTNNNNNGNKLFSPLTPKTRSGKVIFSTTRGKPEKQTRLETVYRGICQSENRWCEFHTIKTTIYRSHGYVEHIQRQTKQTKPEVDELEKLNQQ